MNDLETLMRQAISGHQALHSLISEQEAQLPAMGAKAIHLLALRLDELLATTQRTDEKAFALLQQAPETAGNRQLAEEMLQALRKTAAQSDLLKTRMRSMMAVIQADLSQLKSGRTALGGYRGSADHKGARLSASF